MMMNHDVDDDDDDDDELLKKLEKVIEEICYCK
jgi:hypothetical protein